MEHNINVDGTCCSPRMQDQEEKAEEKVADQKGLEEEKTRVETEHKKEEEEHQKQEGTAAFNDKNIEESMEEDML